MLIQINTAAYGWKNMLKQKQISLLSCNFNQFQALLTTLTRPTDHKITKTYGNKMLLKYLNINDETFYTHSDKLETHVHYFPCEKFVVALGFVVNFFFYFNEGFSDKVLVGHEFFTDMPVKRIHYLYSYNQKGKIVQ